MDAEILKKLCNFIDESKITINKNINLCKLIDSDGSLADRLNENANSFTTDFSKSYTDFKKHLSIPDNINKAFEKFIKDIRESLESIGTFPMFFKSILIELDAIDELLNRHKDTDDGLIIAGS